MRKALVTLTKRIILDKETDSEILKEVLNNSYAEVESQLGMHRITNYSLNVHKRNPQLKTAVDNAATMGSFNAIFKLRGEIPDLWDTSHSINLRTPIITGQLPNVRIEIIDFVLGEKDKLKLAVYFETESLLLLDSIGDKLLLSFPNTEGVDDDIQTYYPNTFFVKLTDDIYFKDYKIL